MSSPSPSGETYNKGLDLLQQLQTIIVSQQEQVFKLNSKLKALREQNDELRRERDDLRRCNAEQQNTIAELSRKSSVATLTPTSPKSHSLRLSLPSVPTLPTSQEETLSPQPDSTSLDFFDTIPILTFEDSSAVTLRRRPRSRGSRQGVYIPSPESGKKVYFEQEREEATDNIIPIVSLPKSDSSMSICSEYSNDGSTTSIDTETERQVCSRTASPTCSISSSIGSETLSPLAKEFVRFGIGSNSLTLGIEDDDLDRPSSRNRLATVGAANFLYKKRKEEAMPLKAPSESLHRQNSFPRRGRSMNRAEQAYLSPDMEMKIQQMILQALGKKFGGLERATKAAVTIQKAYRKYKIDAQFRMIRLMQQQSIRKERLRTMSIRHNRAPSLFRKNKVQSSSATKMDEVRSKYMDATQTKLASSSRREMRVKSTERMHNLETSARCLIRSEELCEEGGDYSMQKSFSAESLESSPSIFSGLSMPNLQQSEEQKELSRQPSTSTLLRKRNIGTNIFNRKPLKGVQYLVYHSVLKDDPMDVAKFLKEHYGLSKEKIGEFVGEIRHDFNMAVLECLVQLIDLSNKTIDEALRFFQQLFRMPGEAQKIDKIMQVFAAEYYQSSKDVGVIKSEEAAYILSFAIMMLHTDLHNPSVRRHMTKKDWLKMNRGTNDNDDFPEDFLLAIYDRIQQKEFATGKDHTHEVMEIRRQICGPGCPPLINAQRRFLGQFEVFQVNDMNKRAIRKHRRILLLFNDVLLVVKTIATNKFEFRKCYSLLNSQAMEFHTNNYKFGVFVQHYKSKAEAYYCNCESDEDKKRLLQVLNDAIYELNEMERERITDFGFSNSPFKENESDGSSDLLSSKNLSSSADDLRGLGKDNVDFRRVATDNAADVLKRSSKDSGFDSPHTTSPLPNGTANGGVTTVSTASNGHLAVSPSRKQRSRTPEGSRRAMKVVPDNTKYNTLKPTTSYEPGLEPLNKRLSTPYETVAKLREHTSPVKTKKHNVS